ncbi:MAG: penicillin-binding protein 1B [Gammaproteobacteria bacterium]
MTRKKKRSRRRIKKTTFSLGFFWPIVLRTSIAVGLCVVGLLFYLDHQIQQRFDAGIHPQPAHIYSRSPLISADIDLRQDKVVDTLDYLGYRRLKKVSGPGSYVVAGNRMDVFINPVPGAPDQSSLVRIEFSGGSVERILDHKSGSTMESVMLEPEFIGSLQLGPYEDRIALKLHQMPELLIKALLAMEDRNFESHIGIDLIAIIRAFSTNLVKGQAVQGGSTITQQLVKNLFLSPERSLSRKATEALMAIVMEIRYSKAEILEHYLNEIFLGQAGNRAVHGFALASEYYFARPVQQLKLHETALLIGMIPAPSYYNPRRHPERALSRRNLVLNTLAKVGAITDVTARTLGKQPLDIAPHRPSSNNRFPAYVDYLHRQIRQYFSEDVLRSDGLKLFTTLDPDVQATAQSALSSTLSTLEQDHGIEAGVLQGAAIVVDIKSGDILGLVGDRQRGFSGFNRAIDAQRPIGSLVKPLVYLTALERSDQYNLASVIEDTPLTLEPPNGEPWSPQNYDKTFRGQTNVLDALTKSYNVPTVRVGLSVGVNSVIETINRLGIKRDLKDYPSLLLGANDHSPLEIAQLYQSIANHGVRTPLRSIVRISDRQNEVIARFSKEQKEVIEPGPAYLVDFALKQVVRRGTAARLASRFDPALQLAGKTGTTDNYRDSWFAGYSGNLLSVVWVGRDDNRPFGLTGSSGAMRVWDKIMTNLWLQPAVFDPPDEIEYLEIDPSSGLLAKFNCPERLSIPVMRTDPITRYAPCAGILGKVQSWFNIQVADPNHLPKVIERSIEQER